MEGIKITEAQWLFAGMLYEINRYTRQWHKAFKKRLEADQTWFKREVKVIMNEIESLKEDLRDEI